MFPRRPDLFRLRLWLGRWSPLLIPAGYLAVALVLGRVLPEIDERNEVDIGFAAESARSVLSAIATGMIAFTGFVVSVVLLFVQYGSVSLSPRIVERIRRDPVVANALGVFSATAVFSVTALGYVGATSSSDQSGDFVPSLSLSMSSLLLLASFLMLFAMIQQIARSLQAGIVVRHIAERGLRAIGEVYPDRPGAEPVRRPAVHAEHPLLVRYEGRPGNIVAMDRDGLVRFASGTGTHIELAVAVGDPLVGGDVLLRVRGAELHAARLRLSRMVVVGALRTIAQDPAYAVRLIVDVAIKALSPAINDPTTAVQALDQLERLLRELGGRELEVGVLRDRAGVERVTFPATRWEDYVRLALEEIRSYGARSVQVMRRMRALLETLEEDLPPERREALARERAILDATVERQYEPGPERTTATTADPQGLGPSRLRG